MTVEASDAVESWELIESFLELILEPVLELFLDPVSSAKVGRVLSALDSAADR